MDEADVEVTGFVENFCGAVGSAFLGCFLVPVGIIIIFMNEKNAVCQQKAFFDAQQKHVATACTYSSGNNDKFVHYTCDVDSSLTVTDSTWQVSSTGSPAWQLSAAPQFYGWMETKKEETEHKNGKDIKRTCYQWSKGWSSTAQVIRVENGQNPECSSGYFNQYVAPDVSQNSYQAAITAFNSLSVAPTEAAAVNLFKQSTAQTAGTSSFQIPSTDFGSIDQAQTVATKIPSTATCTTGACVGFKRNSDSEWYKAIRTGAGPNAGDMKVGFSATGATVISGIGDQAAVMGQTSQGFIKKGKYGGNWICNMMDVFDLEAAAMTPDAMFEKLASELSMLTWILRFFCFFLLWGAFYCCMSPLVEAPTIIPCIGEFISDLIACAVTIVACGCACLCWMFWTGFFFALYRPMIGIPMLLISLGIMGYFLYAKYNKDNKGSEDDNETPDNGGNVQMEQGTGGGPPAGEPPLPEGWIAKVDPATGATYYCFEATGATQWDRPV